MHRKITVTNGSTVTSKINVDLALVSPCTPLIFVQITENSPGVSNWDTNVAHVSNSSVSISSRHSRGAIPEFSRSASASWRRPTTSARTTESAWAERNSPLSR